MTKVCQLQYIQKGVKQGREKNEDKRAKQCSRSARIRYFRASRNRICYNLTGIRIIKLCALSNQRQILRQQRQPFENFHEKFIISSFLQN